MKPRPCANPQYKGKSFGSNAAAWWGFHYKELLTEPKPREVITIYEIDASGEQNWAKAVYNFRWTPQTDPFGVVHKTIDYPGVPVDHRTVQENAGRAQERPHAHPAPLRRARPGPRRGRHGRFHPAQLHRRQHRRLAHRQGRHDVLPGRGQGGAALGGRLARLAGRLRALRHRDRVLAHRHLPAHRAQAGEPGRDRAGRAQLPAAGDAGRVGAPRLQLRELPRRAGRGRAEQDLREVLRSTWPCGTRSARCATS